MISPTATTLRTSSTASGARRSRTTAARRARRRTGRALSAAAAAGVASATWDTVLVGRGDDLRQAGAEPRAAERRPVRSAVVATAEVVLEEDVQDDEQVAAAHLGQAQLGLAVGPIGPRDRQDRVGMAANDGLERQLDGQVEVVGEQRLDVLDHFAPVGLERVGRVVVAVPEEHADAGVDDPVDDELEPRVVHDLAAPDEA